MTTQKGALALAPQSPETLRALRATYGAPAYDGDGCLVVHSAPVPDLDMKAVRAMRERIRADLAQEAG